MVKKHVNVSRSLGKYYTTFPWPRVRRWTSSGGTPRSWGDRCRPTRISSRFQMVQLHERAQWCALSQVRAGTLNASKMLPPLRCPRKKKVELLDTIGSEMSPHDHAPSESAEGDVDQVRARRRLKIELRDLGEYGFTKGCEHVSSILKAIISLLTERITQKHVELECMLE